MQEEIASLTACSHSIRPIRATYPFPTAKLTIEDDDQQETAHDTDHRTQIVHCQRQFMVKTIRSRWIYSEKKEEETGKGKLLIELKQAQSQWQLVNSSLFFLFGVPTTFPVTDGLIIHELFVGKAGGNQFA